MPELWLRLREWAEAHLNWRTLAIAVLVAAVAAFCGGNAYQSWRAEGEGLTLVKDAAAIESSAPTESSEATASGEIVVHVSGAVAAPGVYTLPAEARVNDAVRAAGATEDADLSQLNLAQKLADGQKITVPAYGEATAGASNDASTPSGSGSLININTATAEELESLPGIGEARAQAIITYRETNGGFRSIEELQEVSGIGDKTYADLVPFVTV